MTPEEIRAEFARATNGLEVPCEFSMRVSPVQPDDAELETLFANQQEHLRIARGLGCKCDSVEFFLSVGESLEILFGEAIHRAGCQASNEGIWPMPAVDKHGRRIQ